MNYRKDQRTKFINESLEYQSIDIVSEEDLLI